MEAGAGSDHDGTRNVPDRPFAIFIQVSNGGEMAVLSHGFVSI